MLMAVTRIEILVRIAGKITEPLYLVFYCMRVDDVHYHCNAVAMSLIDECLQFLRRTES